MFVLSQRSLRASNLKRHSEELNKLKVKIEPKLKEISDKASVAYIDILQKVSIRESAAIKSDPFAEEYLQHVMDQIVILWYNDFNHRISRDSFVLIQEIGSILHVKPYKNKNIRNGKLKQDVIDFLGKFSKRCESAKSLPERFNNLLCSYYYRVSDPRFMYIESLEISSPIFDTVLCLKPELENAVEQIDKLIAENRIEEVSIKEFPELYDALFQYKAYMTFWANFYIFHSHLQLDADHLKLNQVLEILFFLFLFQMYGSWGDPDCLPVY